MAQQKSEKQKKKIRRKARQVDKVGKKR